MTVAIRATDLVKSYSQGVRALDGVTLEVNSGEVLVVMGPSGSGKSTLIRTFNGLESLDGGALDVLGVPLDATHGELQVRAIRKRVGMVFQQFNLFPHLSILDNITLAPIKVQQRAKAAAEQRAMELLDQMGIREQAHKYPAQLSGGQQQRVAIARALALRDQGPAAAPFNAFLVNMGMETLPLRMQKHMDNTAAMLEFLSGHDAVAWVKHPTLPDHPSHELVKKMLPKGAGSIIVFGLKGGRDAGKAFIEAVELSSHLANVGDAKTLVIHPASTTHSHISTEAMVEGGLSDDMIRLSVGLEDIADITADFEIGFRAAARVAAKAAE